MMFNKRAGKTSIKRRFVTTITSIILGFFILIVFGTAVTEYRSFHDNVRKTLSFFVENKLSQIDLRVFLLKKSVEGFASSSISINSIIDASGRSSYFPDAVIDFVRAEGIKTLIAFDFAGKPIESNIKELPEWFTLKNIQPAMASGETELFFEESRGSIIIVSPVIYYDTPQGGIAVEVNVSTIADSVMFSSVYEYRIKMGDSWEKGDEYPDGDLISVETRPDRNSILSMFNVSLTAFQSKSTAMQPIFSTFNKMVILGIIGIIISLFISLRLANRLALPILTLTQRVKDGVHPCGPIGTDDELEMLAASFDKSTEEVLRSKKDLELKVRERTVQLQENADELDNQKQMLLSINDDLVNANLKLNNLDKMKDEFISTVSHELRTPLTSIMGVLGIVTSPEFDSNADKDRLLGIAHNNCKRLSRLIDDLLDFQKLTSGKFELSKEALSASDIIDSVIEGSTGYAEKYHVCVRHEKKTTDGVHFLADKHRVYQVIDNMLSNAIKYSEEEGTVDLFAERINGKIRLSVRDYGSGIPKEYYDKIFSKFTQADTADDRAKYGTGLGLSICKSIIDAHGGTIGFESEENIGTTFWFELESA